MSSSQSKGIHFIKIIRHGELKVPTSFMKRYWEEISNPVTLRLPNKTEWKVSWKKYDGDIWFCNNGWKQFAEYVCLSKLGFVVFKYEGNSCFNVILFAKTGLEIKYKENTRDDNTTAAAEDEEEEESDDIPSLPAKRPKSAPQSSHHPLKKTKTNPRDHKETDLRKQQSSSQLVHKKKKKKVEEPSVFDDAAGSSSSIDLQEKIKAFHENVKKKFHLEKDYFTCAIQSSYLKRDLLIIPNEFSRSHLRNMDGRNAILFDDKNKTWNVKLKKYSQMNFIGGWKKFSIDKT